MNFHADLRIEPDKGRQSIRVAVYVAEELWFSYWITKKDIMNGNIVFAPSQFVFDKMRTRLLGEVASAVTAKQKIVVHKKKVIIKKKG